MNSQLVAMLSAWHEARDDMGWVLGTVFAAEGSAYRKAGALSLINAARPLAAAQLAVAR